MQLRAVDLELADHAEHQLAQQRAAISVEQLIQRPAGAVVVERHRLALSQSQQPGVVTIGPLRQAVERLARDAQVAHDHADHSRCAQRDTRIAGRQMALQQRLQPDPVKEGVDDRQRAQMLRSQIERGGWWGLVTFRH